MTGSTSACRHRSRCLRGARATPVRKKRGGQGLRFRREELEIATTVHAVARE